MIFRNYFFAFLFIAVTAQLTPISALAQRQDSPGELAQSDAEKVRGHWVTVETPTNAKTAREVRQAVFTDRQLKMPKVLFEYKLNPSANPKEIDFTLTGGGGGGLFPVPFKGIYRFEGNRLRICYAGSTKGSRPSQFAAGENDGSEVLLLERASGELTLPVELTRMGYKQADPKVADALKQRVRLASRLIRARQFEEFSREIVAPREHIEKANESQTAKALAKIAVPFARLLDTIEQRTPWVAPNGTEAIFDLRDIHFNDLPGKAYLHFSKVNDQWYIRDK